MKVGFIGLGIMGKPMSKNLVKAGHDLVVCDFNQASVDELTALGAKGAANGAQVASECEVIITMVPNSPHVRAAVFGEGGIAETAKPGTVLIDMSSIDPVESKKPRCFICLSGKKSVCRECCLYLAEKSSI